jgi:preprotein translocase subunit SecA
MRDRVLIDNDGHAMVLEAIEDVVYRMCDERMPEGVASDEWDLDGLVGALKNHFTVEVDLSKVDGVGFKPYKDAAAAQILAFYERREQEISAALRRASHAQGNEITEEVARERWRFFEQERYLRAVDVLWKHHLKIMESLKEGIHLEAYAQKNPELEYKKQGFDLFEMMHGKIQDNVTEVVFRAEGPSEEEIEAMRARRIADEQKIILSHQQAQAMRETAPGEGRLMHQGGTYTRSFAKVGRNEPCPCGSGKKFKKCHEADPEGLAKLLGAGGRGAGSPPPSM